jgi:DNA-binding FadR family transcriptional regulator
VPAVSRQRATRTPSRPSTATPGAVPLSTVTGRDGDKLAARVASQIVDDFIAQGWPVGTVLGSSTDFLERYDISRAVFREAVRLLEHHQIAIMRRGPGGGLFVAAPSPAAVSDVVALYLARQGTGIAALAELRVRVEVALVDLVIDRLDTAGAAVLEEAAELDEADQPADVAIHSLHSAIAGLVGNRALELIVLVLIRLTRFHQYRPRSAREEAEIRSAVNRAHLGIARAIQSRDRELARKRMRRHLEALPAHLG